MLIRNINFFFMIWVIILELVSIILNIMIIYSKIELIEDLNQFKDLYTIGSILSIIQESLSIIITIVFGLHSLFFKINRRLLWFVILSILLIFCYIGIMITEGLFNLSQEVKLDKLRKFIHHWKLLLVICLVKTVFYLIVITFTIKERMNLIIEITDSPYNIVDEEFTEEMYRSIMDHSINPSNKSDDFKKMISLIKQKNSEKNSTKEDTTEIII